MVLLFWQDGDYLFNSSKWYHNYGLIPDPGGFSANDRFTITNGGSENGRLASIYVLILIILIYRWRT
jgi:hypothetical protein